MNVTQLKIPTGIGYLQTVTEDLNSGPPETNPARGRDTGPPDNNTSALNHLATLYQEADLLNKGALTLKKNSL